MRSLVRLALALIFCIASPLAARADGSSNSGWKEYVNARFGFKMNVPAELVASRDPDNGDGREYHSRDKEFRVVASAGFLTGATLQTLWQDEFQDPGMEITYKRKATDWYVVSGVKEGTEHYTKICVKNENWAGLFFYYPHAKAKQYDPWVERIVKSFVPFLKSGYDRTIK